MRFIRQLYKYVRFNTNMSSIRICQHNKLLNKFQIISKENIALQENFIKSKKKFIDVKYKKFRAK